MAGTNTRWTHSDYGSSFPTALTTLIYLSLACETRLRLADLQKNMRGSKQGTTAVGMYTVDPWAR
jgi:hypothetical protein